MSTAKLTLAILMVIVLTLGVAVNLNINAAQGQTLPVAASIPAVHTVAAVNLFFRWMRRNNPRLLANRLVSAQRHLVGTMCLLGVIVALMATTGDLHSLAVLAAIPPYVPRDKQGMGSLGWFNELADEEQAEFGELSNQLKEANRAALLAARAEAKAQHEAYEEALTAAELNPYAVEASPAYVKYLMRASVPTPDKCKAYVTRYKQDKMLLTDTVRTSRVDNMSRDNFRIHGGVYHFSGGIREFLDSRINSEYIIVSTTVPKDATEILNRGFNLDPTRTRDEDGYKPVRWHVATGVVRDSGITFVMVRKAVDQIAFLESLGVKVTIKTKAAGNSAGKYLKRLLSFHQHMWEGKVVEVRKVQLTNVLSTDGTVTETITATELDVQYPFMDRVCHYLVRPDDKFTDGNSPISVRHLNELMAELGRKVHAGYAASITAFSSAGLIKGHGLGVNKLMESCSKYDAIFIGPKGAVCATDDRFVFGIMQEKHGSEEVTTDIQSIIHFWLEKFLHEWAVLDMETVSTFVRSGKLHMPGVTTIGKVKQLGRDVPGFSLNLIPKMVVSAAKLKEHRMLHYRDLKIAIPGGLRRYVVCDPRIICADGSTDIRLALLTGKQVYLNGKVMSVAGHRQPNGHGDERFSADAVNDEGLAWLSKSGVIVFAPEHGATMLKKMGGGDQDDSVVIYTMAEHVEHINRLPVYPGEYVAAPKEKAAEWVGGYSRVLLEELIKQKSESKGIGFYVNKLMVFNYLWYLHCQGLLSDSVWETVTKLFILGHGLEEIIDSVVKTGASLAHWDTLLEQFMETCKIVPQYLTARMGETVDAGTCTPKLTPMDLVITAIRNDVHTLQRAAIRYASSVVSLQWKDWSLARQVAYACTLVKPEGITLAAKAHQLYAKTLSESRKTKDLREACNDAEEAFMAKLQSSKHCNGAVAILFRDLHLKFGSDGQHPTGCLWGPNSCELTMAMLKAVAALPVPDSFEFSWAPVVRPVTIVNNMQHVRDEDPVAFQQWKEAHGETVQVLPRLLTATDGYGAPTTGHKVDPFTGISFVDNAEVMLGGAHYGWINPTDINTFINFVRGAGAPTGTLVSTNDQTAMMHLALCDADLKELQARRARTPQHAYVPSSESDTWPMDEPMDFGNDVPAFDATEDVVFDEQASFEDVWSKSTGQI